MALIVPSRTTPSTLTVTSCYAKLASWGRENGRLRADMVFFASQEARQAQAQQVDFQRYEIAPAALAMNAAVPGEPVGPDDPTGLDQFESAIYGALKALPDFAGAQDA